MKKKVLTLFICLVVYFGVYSLCSYLIDKNINWTMAIVSTIGFAIGEIILYCIFNKEK